MVSYNDGVWFRNSKDEFPLPSKSYPFYHEFHNGQFCFTIGGAEGDPLLSMFDAESGSFKTVKAY